MDCQQAENLLIYVDTDDPGLSAVDRAAYFEHLETCPACREAYEQSRWLTELLRTYGKLSPDTIELLEAHGETVPDHLRPEPAEDEDEIDVEAALARFMAKYDAAQTQESDQADQPSRSLDHDLADLRRRVNTLEAYQQPLREQWRRDGDTLESVPLDSASPASASESGVAGHNSSVRNFQGFRRWGRALAVAACLGLTAVTGWMAFNASRSGPSVATEGVHPQFMAELVTATGREPLELGQPITSDKVQQELLLGGMHRVVMNTNTTVTINVAEGAYALDLPEGQLYVEVVPGHAFEVLTPNAQLTITGTKFDVRTSSRQTDLTLLKGGVRFASLLDSDRAVDVLAGHTSSVIGRQTPTRPRVTDALATTAWARSLAIENAITRTTPYVSDDLLDGIRESALAPAEPPSLDKLDYSTWREDKRDWFARQFPWTMRLEKALNEQHGVEADYLDLLMVSGDIWQFHYPRAFDQPIPEFDPASLEQVASYYELDVESLTEAVGHRPQFTPKDAISAAAHTGEAFAAALERWRSDITVYGSNGTDPEEVDELALFSLHASAYLSHTRTAAYLWVKEHPEEAERLLADEGYEPNFLANLIPVRFRTAHDWLVRLANQVTTIQNGVRTSQELLVAPRTETKSCLRQSAELKRELSKQVSALLLTDRESTAEEDGTE